MLLTNVVVRGLPPNCTTELVLKLAPFTVNVNAGSPAVLLVGDMLARVGAGLLIVKVRPGVEVPPAGVGFVTVTCTVPPTSISDVAICVVNWEEFTKVVLG